MIFAKQKPKIPLNKYLRFSIKRSKKMSRSKAELSITKRILLDYIKFKTNNNHTFFAGNDYIAEALDLTPATAKVMVNDLIRKGYLRKETDKYKRRLLFLTGKEYKPLFENMANVDKALLKSRAQQSESDLEYYKTQHRLLEIRCEALENDNNALMREKMDLKCKVRDFSNIFKAQGISDEEVQKLIEHAREVIRNKIGV